MLVCAVVWTLLVCMLASAPLALWLHDYLTWAWHVVLVVEVHVGWHEYVMEEGEDAADDWDDLIDSGRTFILPRAA